MSGEAWIGRGVAAVALVALVPVLVPLAVWIALDSPGGPVYRQTRVGRDGKPFTLFKLRSMRQRAEADLALTQGAADPRVTRPGRFIRRTKLDELPQLLNVVRGDMGWVGPRPEVPAYVAHYTAAQRAVLSVPPGLTDPASLAGFDEAEEIAQAADPERHYLDVILPRKLALQLDYLGRRTWWTDLGVIAGTARRMLSARRG